MLKGVPSIRTYLTIVTWQTTICCQLAFPALVKWVRDEELIFA